MRRVLLPLVSVALLIVAVVLYRHEFAGTQTAMEVAGEEGAAETLGPFRRMRPPRLLPDFRFVDTSGVAHRLTDFKGKTVLLNLWATWCPPCRKEMPSLDRLQARLGGKDFHVLTISTDLKGISVVQEFFQKIGISSLQPYIDHNGETETALKAPGLPTTLLIDRNGDATGVKVGPMEWDSDAVVALLEAQISSASEPENR